MLYIYQADRMSMLDLSEVSIDPQFGNTLPKMSLLQELYVGGESHGNWTMSPGNTGYMTNLDLGDMPFLRILDVRNTEVQTVNASKCPRLVSVYADNPGLSAITLAETSPIDKLTLPGNNNGTRAEQPAQPYLSRWTDARWCSQDNKDICQ